MYSGLSSEVLLVCTRLHLTSVVSCLLVKWLSFWELVALGWGVGSTAATWLSSSKLPRLVHIRLAKLQGGVEKYAVLLSLYLELSQCYFLHILWVQVVGPERQDA